MKAEKAWSNKEAWRLYKLNWKLCHDIVDERDGHKCILCGQKHSLQLDHCITRGRKTVFFNIDNLNYLCSGCHTSKSFQSGGPVDKMVDLHTMRRMGKPKYEEMVQMSNTTLPEWRRVWYQEKVNEELLELLEYWKIRNE